MSINLMIVPVLCAAMCACGVAESASASWGQRSGYLQEPDTQGDLSWLQQTPTDSPEYPTLEKMVCPTCICVQVESHSDRCFSSDECPPGKVCTESVVLHPYWDAKASCSTKNKLPTPKYCKAPGYGGALGELVEEECTWSPSCYWLGQCTLQKKGENGAPFDRCVASPSGCAASVACKGIPDVYPPNPSGNGCDAVQLVGEGYELSPPQCGKLIAPGSGDCSVLDASKGVLKCVKL